MDHSFATSAESGARNRLEAENVSNRGAFYAAADRSGELEGDVVEKILEEFARRKQERRRGREERIKARAQGASTAHPILCFIRLLQV